MSTVCRLWHAGSDGTHALTTEAVIERSGAFRALARIVASVHTGIVLFFALGWLLPWHAAHWTIICGGILMQSLWYLLDDNCPLTLLERWLDQSTGDDSRSGQQIFVSRLLSKVLNRPVSDHTGNVIAYLVLYASMLICAARLAS